MAVTATTLQKCAQQAVNAEDSFVATFLSPLVPVPNAFPTTGGDQFKAIAKRIARDNARSLPGELSLAMTGDSPATNVGVTFEDYEISIRLKAVKHTLSIDAFEGIKSEITDYETGTVSPMLSQAVLIDRERSFRAFVDASGTFDAANIVTGAAGTYWDDDSVDPFKQFETAIKSMRTLGGFSRNMKLALAIHETDLFALRRNAKVRAYFGDAAPELTTTGLLRKITEILFPQNPSEVLIRVSQAAASTGNAGNPGTVTDIMAGRTILAAIPRASEAGLSDRCWAPGYTVNARHGFSNGLRASRFELPDPRRMAWQLDSCHQPGVFDNKLAFVWKGIVSGS